MWFVIPALAAPIVYSLVSHSVDSISDKVKENKRKKYYGEEELINVTTYNNKNITENDIILLFLSQLKRYRQDNYVIDYEVYSEKEKQNYAWSVKTTKQTYGWGIFYNIRFHFSNGRVYLSFSNSSFTSGGQSSKEYYSYGDDNGSAEIEKILGFCREESRIKWKMHGREPKGSLPFNYIPLPSGSSSSNGNNDKTSSNNNGSKNQKEGKSTNENKNQHDLLSFYRNLLGLKLRFSHDELKKCYREAVGKYHPDRYGASSQRDRENAEMLMKQVNEAYEKLKAFAQ